MRESIPQKLYKYQPLNQYSLINLIKRQLYFSKPENFNDPYDCDPPVKIATSHRTEKNKKALYDLIRSSIADKLSFDTKYLTKEKPNKRFTREFIDSPNSIREQIRAKVGVTCFSEKVDDILLWSYYADMHKGFCLEFDTQIPIMEGQQKTEAYKIKYTKSNSYRRFSIRDILMNQTSVSELLLTTKSYHWHYEEEWRIFSNEGGDKAYPFNINALTGIYFGYKMPQEYKDVITSVLTNPSNQNTPHDLATLANRYPHIFINGTEIILYDMKLNNEKFMVSHVDFRRNSRI
jgi:hypothetical protein